MLDTHTIELINADLDRELGPAETAELDALLESSAEAREMRAELLRLSNFLNALPDQAPPPDLSRQILEQITLPRKPTSFSLRGLLGSFQPAATAAAFAAGLLLTVGFYEMAPRHTSTSDLNSMVGSIVANKQDQASKQLEQLSIDESWLSGSVSLQENNGLVMLNFDLDSTERVEIEMGLFDAGLVFAGIAQAVSMPETANEIYQVSGGTLRVENQGRQSFVVFLRNAAKADGGKGINIEFSSGGKRLVKGVPRTS